MNLTLRVTNGKVQCQRYKLTRYRHIEIGIMDPTEHIGSESSFLQEVDHGAAPCSVGENPWAY
jgi:hypothetical protein